MDRTATLTSENTSVKRPEPACIRKVELLEPRLLLAIDVPSIVAQYNQGASAMRQAGGVSAALEEAFGVDLDLPMIRESVGGVLKAVDDLTAPFKSVSVAVNATTADLKQQLVAAGLTVEYASEVPDPSGDVLRVRWQRDLNELGKFSLGGAVGFEYLSPENDVQDVHTLFEGTLTPLPGKASVSFVFGIQADGDSPVFFVEEGGGVRFSGLGASAVLRGSIGIGYLLNVDADATLRADLAGELVLHDDDADDRLYLDDLASTGQLQNALSGELTGSVTLEAKLTAHMTLLPSDIQWVAKLGVDFKGGQAVPRKTDFTTLPSVAGLQGLVDDAVAALRGDFDFLGGLGDVFGGSNAELVPIPTFSLGDEEDAKSLGELMGVPDDQGFEVVTPEIDVITTRNLVSGRRVDLLKIQAKGRQEWRFDSPDTPIAHIPFAIGPIPASVRLSVGYGAGAGYSYYAGIGVDTVGVYIDPRTNFTMRGEASAELRGKLNVGGLWDAVQIDAGVGLELAGRVGIRDPDPSDGRIYVGELFEEGGDYELEEGLLDVMDVSLRGEAFAYAKGTLKLPKVKVFGKTIGGDRTLFRERVDLADFSLAVGEADKRYERPEEQTPRRSLPTPRGQSLRDDWFEDGVLTLDSDALEGKAMSVTVSRLDNGNTLVNWVGVGKREYTNLAKLVFVGSNGVEDDDGQVIDGDDWLYVAADVAIEVDARGRRGDDYLSAGIGRARLWGGEGKDELFGGAGNDEIDGEAGDDYVAGGAGNDAIAGNDGNDQLFGDDGNDTLRGDDGSDFIEGGAGDDDLLGGAGIDVMLGGEGNDRLRGGQDEDRLSGGDGSDRVEGGAGADAVLGGAGDDTLVGGAGDDKLLGDDGNDTIWGDDPATGDTGNDVAWGGQGDDSLHGGLGDDQLFGNEGDDVVRGGDANDELDGGAGRDQLFGERGNDRLRGGGGPDDLNGGENDDVLVIDFETGGQSGGTFLGGSGRDGLEIAGSVRTTDENGKPLVDAEGYPIGGDNVADWITLDQLAADQFRATKLDPATGQIIAALDFTLDGSTSGDIEVLSIAGLGGDDVITVLPSVRKHVSLDGGAGNDTLTGGAGNDVIYGGLGHDTLDGGGGDDGLYGGESISYTAGEPGADTDTGNDTLMGGAGNDVLYGGAGSDSLDGGEGRDVQDGGDGDDVIQSGDGPLGDVIDGGAGDDQLSGGAGIDVLCGGGGNDTIRGEGGADVIDGGEGDDQLFGGRGRDVILGGPGGNWLYAVDESMIDGDPLDRTNWDVRQRQILDELEALLDAREPLRGEHNRLLAELELVPPYSEGNPDERNQRDALEAEIARLGALLERLTNEMALLAEEFKNIDPFQTVAVDVLIGDSGVDHLFGSQFPDTLSGGGGDDFLYFSNSDDVFTGGSGSDKLVFRGTEQDDEILAYARPSGDTGNLELRITMNGHAIGGATSLPKRDDIEAIRIEALGGDDTVQLDFGLNAFALFEIDGGKGDDRLVAGLLNQWFENGTPYQWNVMMWGREGNDILLGGAGDDFLIGGDPSNHYRYGDEDWIKDRRVDSNDGDPRGRDLVDGGAGADWLTGGPGDDFALGGSGRDILVAGARNGNDFMAASTIYYRNVSSGVLEPHPEGVPNSDSSEDILYGGPGDQFLFGDSADRDALDPAASSTTRVFGHNGNDEVSLLVPPAWFVGDLTRTTFIDSSSANLFDSLNGLPQADHPFWAPVASAGGPYEIAEGQDLQLDAEYRRDINELYQYGAGTWMDFYYERGEPKPIGGFRWSLLVDGVERALYEGEAPTLNWATLEALGVRGSETVVEVRLRVEDTRGRVGVSLATRVNILNAPPTAIVATPLQVTTGVPFIVDLRANDPSQSDRLAGFTWEIDWGNGQQTELDSPTGKVELHHAYVESGDHLVKAWAYDRDGAASAPIQRLILARRIAGDADGNDLVDLADFGALKQHFGAANRDVRQGDFTADGQVDLTDFGVLKENFGRRAVFAALGASGSKGSAGTFDELADDLPWQAALHLAFAELADEDK